MQRSMHKFRPPHRLDATRRQSLRHDLRLPHPRRRRRSQPPSRKRDRRQAQAKGSLCRTVLWSRLANATRRRADDEIPQFLLRRARAVQTPEVVEGPRRAPRRCGLGADSVHRSGEPARHYWCVGAGSGIVEESKHAGVRHVWEEAALVCQDCSVHTALGLCAVHHQWVAKPLAGLGAYYRIQSYYNRFSNTNRTF